MGYFERAAAPVQWRLADEFVLLDRFFQGIHGGSFAQSLLSHSGKVAEWREAPAEHRAADRRRRHRHARRRA